MCSDYLPISWHNFLKFYHKGTPHKIQKKSTLCEVNIFISGYFFIKRVDFVNLKTKNCLTGSFSQ